MLPAATNPAKGRGGTRRSHNAAKSFGAAPTTSESLKNTREHLSSILNHEPARDSANGLKGSSSFLHKSFLGLQPSSLAAAPPSVGSYPPRQTLSKTKKTWWRVSYVFDWGLAALALALAFILSNVLNPRQSIIVFPGDPDKSLPYLEDSIPSWANLLLSLVAPFLLCVLIQVILAIRENRFPQLDFHNLHHAALTIFCMYAFTKLTVASLKLSIGAPRPSYFNYPNPDGSGRESFPSGHASIAWGGWLFFMLYLMSATQLRQRNSAPVYKVVFNLAPLIIPIIICITRYVDNKHRWEDLIGGALIGSGFATVFYYAFFGELWEVDGDMAKTRR